MRQPAAIAPRVTVIEGRAVAVYERSRPIPPELQLMIEGGRDRTGRPWAALRVVYRRQLRLAGARRQCLEQEHRLSAWLEGFHTGSDNVVRYLHLEACTDCGAVCVRDRSFDSLEGLSAGRRPLRRRDHVIGWYSGARPNQRVYT